MSGTIPNFIAGRPVESESGRTAPVFNPATGEQSGTVGLSSSAEIRAAVSAARDAFPGWADTPALKRARILNAFGRILEERTDELPGMNAIGVPIYGTDGSVVASISLAAIKDRMGPDRVPELVALLKTAAVELSSIISMSRPVR